MIILGIDPGNIETGFLFMDTSEAIRGFGKVSTEDMLSIIKKNALLLDHVIIEAIAAYGVVGKTVLDTCVIIGRIYERIKMVCPMKTQIHLVYRKTVATYITDTPKANDSAVRQALIDRYEPGGDTRKKLQGKLKGISKDVWSALALSTYMLDAIAGKHTPKWTYIEPPKETTNDKTNKS